jgi:PAS domain S-box-containing protein
MDILAIQYIVAICAAIAGFVAALKPVRKCVFWVWGKTLGRRGQQLDRIEAELRPNGSTSMRDAIDRIEDRQYEFEAFMGASLNTERDAIFRTDAAGSLYAINRAHQRLLGYSLDEMKGDGWINCVHKDNRAKIVDQWARTVEAEMELNEDIKFLHADGSDLMAHANVYRELDGMGKLRGYLGVISVREPAVLCPHADLCKANGVYLHGENV